MKGKSFLENLTKWTAILARHAIFLISCASLSFAADKQVAQNLSTANPYQEEIEATVFDLYLSDKLQGSILVRYTDEWFEIDDPRDVVDQLKDVKEPEKVLPMLEGRIFKSRTEPGIGSVSYDLRTFRIIIKLDPSLLPEQTINLLNRLPDPENKFSVQQTAGIASTGDINNEQSAALNHRTLASMGKYFAVLDATAVQGDQYIFTEGAVGGVVDDYETAAGLLQTKGQLFASSVDIAGFKFETSQDIFLDQDRIRGSKLEIFIPSRSRVEFYRDQRLLSVQILDYGLQEIDTSQFPDGSYDVQIIINEDVGSITSESRFFTKSGYLAIRSRPIFFLQAGALRDQVNLEDTPIFQGGFRVRTSGITQLKGSIYGTNEIQIGELETTGVFREYIFGTGASLSTEGDSGVSANMNGSLAGLNFDFNIAQTLNGGLEFDENDFTVNDQGVRELSINQQAQLVSAERSTISGGVTKNYYNVSLRLSGNRNKSPLNTILNTDTNNDPEDQNQNEDRYAYGPRFEWRIINDQRKSLRFDTSYLKTDEGSKLAFGLYLRYNFDAQFSYNSDLNIRKESSGNESSFRNTFSYDNKQRSGVGSRFVYTNDLRSREEPENDDFLTNQFIGDHTNNYLRSNGFIRDITQSENDGTATGINAETAFVYVQGSGISVSHPPKEGAVLIAELESSTSDEKFELLVNGQPFATIVSGQSSVIGLNPFKTYKISIRPVGDTQIVDFDNKIYEVTLFPGNVVRKTWSIKKVFIVTGTLVDGSGALIASHRIKGTHEYVVTEEDGSFQAELFGGEKLSIDSKGFKCSINYSLPSVETEAYVIDLGKVVCN